MMYKEKIQAQKKADIALCKMQDIFYLNPSNRVLSRIEKACDAIRELMSEIENTDTK